LEAAVHEALPPYVRRHLASHAVAGGRLDDVLTPELLPWLDYNRVAEEVRLAVAPHQSPTWVLLRAWRSVKHRWLWDDPAANAGALDVALLSAGTVPPVRHLPGYSWQPLWADWLVDGTVVGSDEGSKPSAAFGSVAGKGVLFGSREERLWIWEAATGAKLSEPLYGHSPIEALAAFGDLVLCLSRDGEVTVWDAALQREQRSQRFPGNAFRSLAVGYVDGLPAFVTAGDTGEIHICAVSDGRRLRPPLPGPEYVRGVALHDDMVAAGTGDGTVVVWDLHENRIAFSANAGHEVNAVALGFAPMLGSVVVAGTSDPSVRLWRIPNGETFDTAWLFQPGDEVRCVAFDNGVDGPLMAAGSTSGQVWVGEPTTDMPFLLQHAAGVTMVAFGEVDGRTMVATTSDDGNTRLWDPIQPSAAPPRMDGPIQRVSLLDTGVTGVHAFSGLANGVAHWTPDGERHYLELDLPGQRRVATKHSRASFVQLRAGLLHGLPVLLTVVDGHAQVWEVGLGSHRTSLLSQTNVDDEFGADLYLGHDQALVATPWTKRVLVTDVLTGRSQPLRGAKGSSASTGFVESGNVVWYAVLDENGIHCFDPYTGKLAQGPLWSQDKWVTFTSGSLADRPTLALGSGDRITLLDVTSGKRTGPVIDLPTAAEAVAWAGATGEEVLLTAHHATLRAWSPRTGRKLAELPFGTAINDVAAATAPDGSVTVYVAGPGVVASRLLPPPAPDLT
jgi:WD40 repeat protein